MEQTQHRQRDVEVYQIHFDSSDKTGRVFDTFYFEPENVYEGKAGQLFLAGSAKDSAKDSAKVEGSFISALAGVVREEFYSVQAKQGRTALRKTLKQANKFLQKIAESGSVEWLSDFNFAILNIVPKKSGAEDKPAEHLLNFTRAGSIKIVLLRAGEVINLGQKIKEEGIDPYPIKVFHHIASGKIQGGDRILILNEGLYERLLEKGTLRAIASISFLSRKKINRVFASLSQDLWGFCLLVDLAPSGSAGRIKLFFQGRKDHRLIKSFGAVMAKLRPLQRHIKIPDLPELPRRPKIFTLPKLKRKVLAPRHLSIPIAPKNLVWLLFLAVLLLAGRFIMQKEMARNQSAFRARIDLVQEKVQNGEHAKLQNRQADAKHIYMEAWEEVNKLPEPRTPDLKDQLVLMKQSIYKELLQLYFLKTIIDPEVFFEWEEKEFLPQRLVVEGSDLLCFASYEPRVFRIAPDGSSSTFETDFHFKSAVSLEPGAAVFLTENDELVLMEQGVLGSPFSLEKLNDEFQLTHMSSFASSVYFWDERSGQVAKYSKDEPGAIWSAPYEWLRKPNALKETNVFSMAVDGSIWFLSADAVAQYYKGELVKELPIDVFPKINFPAQLFTSKDSPHLYIMESAWGRIVLLDKESGEVLAQYKSGKFKNLKHLVLFEQGVVFLLDGAVIYKILF